MFGVLVGVGVGLLLMAGLLWLYLYSEEAAKRRRRIPMGAAGWVRGTVRFTNRGAPVEVVVNRSGLDRLSGRIGGIIFGYTVAGSLAGGVIAGKCGVELKVSLSDGKGRIGGRPVSLELHGNEVRMPDGDCLAVGDGELTGRLGRGDDEVRVSLKYAEMPPLALAAIVLAVMCKLEDLSQNRVSYP